MINTMNAYILKKIHKVSFGNSNRKITKFPQYTKRRLHSHVLMIRGKKKHINKYTFSKY